MRQVIVAVAILISMLAIPNDLYAQKRDPALAWESVTSSSDTNMPRIRAADESAQRVSNGNSMKNHIFAGALIGAAVGGALTATGAIGGAYPLINVLQFAAGGAVGGLILFTVRH